MYVIMRLKFVNGRYIDPQVVAAFQDADKALSYVKQEAEGLECKMRADREFSLEHDAMQVYYFLDCHHHFRYEYRICLVTVS